MSTTLNLSSQNKENKSAKLQYAAMLSYLKLWYLIPVHFTINPYLLATVVVLDHYSIQTIKYLNYIPIDIILSSLQKKI